MKKEIIISVGIEDGCEWVGVHRDLTFGGMWMNHDDRKAATWVAEFIKSSKMEHTVVFDSVPARTWWDSVAVFSGFEKFIPTQTHPRQTDDTSTPSGKGDESVQETE